MADGRNSLSVTVPASRDRFWFTVIGIFSVAAVAAIAFVLTVSPAPVRSRRVDAAGREHRVECRRDTVLLVAAFIAIRRRAVTVHRALVLVRVRGPRRCFSSGYLLYHAFGEGPQAYLGPVPWLYYCILISHIVLAVTIVPLALITLRRGWTRHPSHRTIARVALPIWLYVSITGVAIFTFLYWPLHLAPRNSRLRRRFSAPPRLTVTEPCRICR